MKSWIIAGLVALAFPMSAQQFDLDQADISLTDKFTVTSQSLFGCSAGSIADPGTVDVCPSNFAIFESLNVSIPTGGGFTFNFNPGPTGSGATGASFGLTGPFPTLYPLDNDLNGILSGNGLPPFVGEWLLEGVVYSDASDPGGSVCSIMGTDMSINFLPPGSCTDPCAAGQFNSLEPQLILPGEQTFATVLNNFIPEGGEMAYIFAPGPDGTGGPGGFNLTGANPIFAYDSDVNGVMSANGLPPLAGTWFISIISANPDLPDGSLDPCDISTIPLEVYFANSSDCLSILDASSPYFPTDPIYLQVTTDIPTCCTLPWGPTCESAYENHFNGCTYTQAINFAPLAMDDDGTCFFCEGDANYDGQIDVQDILSVLGGFGSGSCTP